MRHIYALFNTATGAALDTKSIAAMLPKIIRKEYAETACRLLKHYGSDTSWLPEALALFNTPNLSESHKQDMLASIFPKLGLDAESNDALVDICARIGRYGFSFPQWRFVSQSLGEKALIEHYGMERLHRKTDVRSPELPKSDPNRDEYGIGFVKQEGNWTIEYRRAYILCSNQSDDEYLTILIRNSSYFFGRDRLEAPAYISWEKLSEEELQDITEDSFGEDGKFVPFTEAFSEHQELPISDKLFLMSIALDRLDQEDMALSDWLLGDGMPYLEAFIDRMNEAQIARGSQEPPFYLSLIQADMPPWQPQKSFAATVDILPELVRCSDRGNKLVLLSGATGDVPVKPAPKAPVARLEQA